MERKLFGVLMVWQCGSILCDVSDKSTTVWWIGICVRSLAVLMLNIFIFATQHAYVPENVASPDDSTILASQSTLSLRGSIGSKSRISAPGHQPPVNTVWPATPEQTEDEFDSESEPLVTMPIREKFREIRRHTEPFLETALDSYLPTLEEGDETESTAPSLVALSRNNSITGISNAVSVMLHPPKVGGVGSKRYSGGDSSYRRRSSGGDVGFRKSSLKIPRRQGGRACSVPDLGLLLSKGADDVPHRVKDPLNLLNLKDPVNEPSSSSSDSAADSPQDEVWEGVATNESDLPLWLLEHLQQRGWLSDVAKTEVDRRKTLAPVESTRGYGFKTDSNRSLEQKNKTDSARSLGRKTKTDSTRNALKTDSNRSIPQKTDSGRRLKKAQQSSEDMGTGSRKLGQSSEDMGSRSNSISAFTGMLASAVSNRLPSFSKRLSKFVPVKSPNVVRSPFDTASNATMWRIPMPSRRTSTSTNAGAPQLSRRQSVQEMITDFTEGQATSSVLGMRKNSVIIGKQDFLQKRLLDFADGGNQGENDQEGDDLVVLPFFKPASAFSGRRNCNCKGNIHTCMTPASTMAENSVFQSYLCSAWCSKDVSVQSSRLASEQGSRRGSDMVRASISGKISETQSPNAVNELHVSVLNSVPKEDLMRHQMDTISPQQLLKSIINQTNDILVVDVRGRDHEGGHIMKSIHMKTADVLRSAASLMGEIRKYKVDNVVFTCMYSVLRARKCANALIQFQTEEQADRHSPIPVRVSVLAGGFHSWVNTFRTDSAVFAKVVEDFKEDCWTLGPDELGLVHVMDAVWSTGGQKILQRNLEEVQQELAKLQGSSDSERSSRRNSYIRRSSDDGAVLDLVPHQGVLPGSVVMSTGSATMIFPQAIIQKKGTVEENEEKEQTNEDDITSDSFAPPIVAQECDPGVEDGNCINSTWLATSGQKKGTVEEQTNDYPSSTLGQKSENAAEGKLRLNAANLALLVPQQCGGASSGDAEENAV
eukprot:GEMP01004817.1.p1 GENE.GEMP01004817.1~~GEMP01004817.1.p1  ORF type:complete len:991 (+),score=229.20 GEMP01004817.1:349-3321(+)